MEKFEQSFLDQQKKSLLEEKAKIEEKIKELKKFPDYGGDEEDGIQELSDYESNLSIEGQLEILLKKINAALLAIEKGEYGRCAKCRENIEQGRLEIMPYADLCVNCQSKND